MGGEEMYVKTVEETEEFARRWEDERGQPRSPSLQDVLDRLDEIDTKLGLIYTFSLERHE